MYEYYDGYVNSSSFDNDDMKSSKCHLTFVLLIFLLFLLVLFNYVIIFLNENLFNS